MASRYAARRTIAAPADRVFDTVAHIESYQEAVPHTTGVGFLTEQRTGVGTRLRETRSIRGREGKTELEVTEFAPPQKCAWFRTQAGPSGTPSTPFH